MNALLMLAMLQVAPQDTVVVRVPIPEREQIADTTIVYVDVDVHPVSDSVVLAVQASIDNALTACCLERPGRPDWFYAGILTLGSLFLYRYWTTSGSDDEVMADDVPEGVVPTGAPIEPPPDPCNCHHCRGPGG